MKARLHLAYVLCILAALALGLSIGREHFKGTDANEFERGDVYLEAEQIKGADGMPGGEDEDADIESWSIE